METLVNQFKSFLLELPSSRQGGKKGLSKVSVKNYLSDIRRFLDWLSQYQPQISSAVPQRLSSDHFQAYLDFLTHQDLPHSTISRHFSSLRRFATFIEIVYHQPPLIIPTITSPDSTPKAEPTSIQTSSPNLLSSFSQYLKDQQKSASTVRNYLSDIRHFLAWVDQHPDLKTLPSAQQLDSSLESDVVDQYSHYLKLTNTPSSTSSRRLSSLNIFTQFATNQGLVSPKVKSETNSPRLKPIPALSWLKPKTTSRQSFNLYLPSFIQKPITRLTSSPVYRSYHQLPFTPYLHLALLVLFTSAFALFGFRQIIIQSERISAYPSTPNRPTRQLSFQGRLTDSSGTPIVTPINATFKLWDQETGGTQGTCSGGAGEDCLYSTATCSVDPDQDGIFNILLGDGTCGSEIPADVFTENTAVWLEVEVATETLTPRQPIATVAYALNSETVSGIPVSASGSATVNTLFFMNSSGEIVLGEQNPSIIADSGNFTLQGEALTLSTTPFSEGDITIAPDGIGQVNFIGGTTTDDFIRVVNANLTTGSLISGYVGNDNNTGELLRLSSGSSETDRFVVTTGGQTTIDALALGKSAFIVNQLNSGPIFTASASGTPKFTINNSGTITLANNTIITDDTNYTRFSRGIAVGSNETYYFNASGNINANNLTLSGTTTLNGLTYTWPSTQSTNYVLSTNGSGTLSWVDPAAAAAGSIYWLQSDGAVYPKNATVDLLVGGNSTASAIFSVNSTLGSLTLKDSSLNTLFSVSPSGLISNVPSSFTSSGNVSLAYDLLLTNQTASSIKSNAPLTIEAGESFESNHLTLKTYNQGNILLDSVLTQLSGGLSVSSYATISSSLALGTSSAPAGAGHLSMSGNLNLTSGDLQTNSTTRLTNTGNLTNIGTTQFNGLTYTWPTTHETSGYVLSNNGSGTLTWVDPAAAAAGSIYWTQANGTVYPKNATVDLLVGGNSTSSAKFAFINVNSGTPTASISGTTANVATYLTGEGNLGVTNMAPLNIGGASTGSVQLSPKGTTGLFVDGSGNVGIGTTTPSGTLHIASGALTMPGTLDSADRAILSSATGNTMLTLLSNSTNGLSGLRFGDSDSSTQSLITHDNSNNSLKLWTAATPQVTILNTGNVGIGTTNPYKPLHLQSSDEDILLLRRPTTANLQGTGILFGVGDTGVTADTFQKAGVFFQRDDSAFGGVTGGWAKGKLIFAVDNTTDSSNATISDAKMTIQPDGLVGIGTTSPAAKLDVSGNLAVSTHATISGSLALGTSSAVGGVGHLSMSGNLNTSGNLTVGGTTTLGGLTYTWPSSQSSNYVLSTNGSGTLSWVDPAGAASGAIYWTQTAGALHPKNATVDLLVGGSASASAIFRVDATTGNLVSLAGSKWMPRSDSTTALNIANAAGTSFVTFDTTNQRVGIGTSSPSQKFQVVGTSVFGGSSDSDQLLVEYTTDRVSLSMNNGGHGGKNLRLGTGGWSNDYISFGRYGYSTEFARFTGQGRLGIGTTTPASFLDVTTNTALDSTGKALVTLNQLENQDIFTASASGTTRFVITNSGNVGIGTTTPSQKLDVVGGGNTRIRLQTTGSTSVSQFIQYSDSYWSGFELYSSGATGTTAGIANAGLAALQSYAANLLLTTALSGSDIILAPAGSESMRLDAASGNVGIGTTSPTEKLDISGNLKLSGTTTFNGLTYTWPSSQSSNYVLSTNGSGTLSWSDPAALAGSTIYWTQANGTVYPKNATVDLLVGGNSTSSAKFAFINVNSGTPTASISGNLSLAVPTGSAPATKLNIYNGGTFGIRTSTGGDAGLTERLTVLNNGNVGVGTSSPQSLLHIDNQVSATKPRLVSGDYTVDGAGNSGSSLFTANAWYEYPAIVGIGNGTSALDIPSISSYGTVGLVGVGGSSTGGRTNVGVYGHAYFDTTLGGNSGNNLRAGYFSTRLTSAVTDFNGSMYGVYTTSNSTGGTQTGGSVYGLYSTGIGETNNTVYGGYFSASGGTTNYGLYSAAGLNYLNGNLGIGDTSPASLLTVGNGDLFQINSSGIITAIDGVAHTIDDVSGNLTLASNSTTVSINDNLSVTGSINSTTGYYYANTSSPMNLELTRTVPTTVNDYVEIGNITLSNGAHNLRVSITVPSSSFSVSKTYLIPIKYNQATSWQKVAPISDTGAYATNNFDLDIQASANTASLRIRRTAGSTAGTAYIRIESTGYTADAFTATSATGSTTAPTAIFSSTPLAQVESNVGIGTTSPSSKLTLFDGDMLLTGTTNTDVRTIKSFYDLGTLRLQSGTSAGNVSSIDLGASSDTIAFSTNSVEAMRISGANLGIGTTSPTEKLDISGNLKLSGTTTFNGLTYTWPGSQTANYVLATDGSGGLSWTDPAGAASSAIYWNQSGGALYPKNATVDLLVGGSASASAIFRVDTSTGNLISVAGSKWMPRSDSTTALNIANTAGTSFVTFDTTNQRVGIGTSSPVSPLSVGSSSQFQVNSSGIIASIDGVAHTIDDVSGNLTLASNSTTVSINDSLDIAGNITLSGGNRTIATTGTNNSLTVNANGTGTLTLDTTGAGTLTLGQNATTINVGSGTNNETINIGNSTGNDTIYLGSNSGTDIVNILTGAAGTQTLNIGNSSNGVNLTAYTAATTGNGYAWNANALTSGAATYINSSSITSGQLLRLNQSTSTMTGTGLYMNFGTSGGTFTGNFLNLLNNGTSRFSVSYRGGLTASYTTPTAGEAINLHNITFVNTLTDPSSYSAMNIASNNATYVSATTGGTDESQDNDYEGFKFNSGSNYTGLGGITLRLRKSASAPATGWLRAHLRADNAGQPSTTNLASSGYLYAANISTTNSNYVFNFSATLTANTDYWIVIQRSGLSNNEIIFDTTTSGTNEWAEGNGSTWSVKPTTKGYYYVYTRSARGLSSSSYNNYGIYGSSTHGTGTGGGSTTGVGIYGSSSYNYAGSFSGFSGLTITSNGSAGVGINLSSTTARSGNRYVDAVNNSWLTGDAFNINLGNPVYTQYQRYFNGSTYTDTTTGAAQLGGSLYTLLADSDDIYYFGRSSNTTSYRNFFFDVNGTPSVTGLTWEYATAADVNGDCNTWTSFTPTIDETNNLSRDGMITIPSSATPVQCKVDGVNTYWWRMSATTVTTTANAYASSFGLYGGYFARFYGSGQEKFRMTNEGATYFGGQIYPGVTTAENGIQTSRYIYDNTTSLGMNTNLYLTNSADTTLTLNNSDTTLVQDQTVGQLTFYSNDASANGTGDKTWIKAINSDSVGTATDLLFGTANNTITTGTEKMRITSAGYVGIGTSTPSQALDISGNLKVSGTTIFNNLTYIWPASHQTAGYVLSNNGSGTLSWIDANSAAAGSIYWTQANGTVYPKNATVDLLVGGNSTSSAKFAFINVNSGTPTASISGTTANVATYLTGEGNLATTNMAPLTIGGSTTGSISLANNTAITGNLTTSGNADIDGTLTSGTGNAFQVDTTGNLSSTGTTGITLSGAGADLTFSGTGDHDITASAGTLRLGAATLTGSITGNSQSITGLSQLTVDNLRLDGNTIDTTSGNLTLDSTTGQVDVNDNLNITGSLTVGTTTEFNNITYTWPSSQTNNYVLSTNGSGTLSWVDPASAVASTIYWAQSGGALYPKNATVDLLVGSSASASAIFRVDTSTGNLISVAGSKWMPRSDSTTALNIANAAGTSFVTFDTTNQRVGIGTSSPSAPLHVDSGTWESIFSDGTIDLKHSNGNTYGKIGNMGGTYGLQSYVSYPLVFRTNNLERVRIDWTNGNVGIGTTSPSEKLDVAGNATVSGNLTFTGSASTIANRLMQPLTIGDSQTGNLRFFSSSNTLDSTGNLTLAGNINLTSGDLQTGGTSRITNAGNLTNIGTTQFNGLTYTWPASHNSSGYILSNNGSGTLTWVDPATAAAGSIYWLQSDGAVYPKNATVDLLVGGNSTSSAKFAINSTLGSLTLKDSSLNTLFSVSPSGLVSNVPSSFTSSGNVSFAYDLLLTNQTSSSITSNAPLTIEAGESFESNHLTLKTYNQGNILLDSVLTQLSGGLSVSSYATISSSLALGNTNASAGPGHLNMTGNLTMGGNLNLTSGALQTNSTTRLTNTGNLTNIGTTQFNGLTYTWPATHETSGYVLSNNGSGTLTWVDANSAASGSIYWTQANGTVYPKNATVDLLVGGNSTSSAKFAFINVNSGTPTASISGTTANVATYLTGEGNLGVTNMAPLTIGGSTTGSLTLDENTTITGNLALSGNEADLTFSGTGNHDITASAGTLRFGAATLTGAITGNSQNITGLNNLTGVTSTFSTSVTTPLLTNAGNLTLSATGANNILFSTNGTERWRVTSTGILQSNGAQTIQTSNADLTLATGGGDGDIVLMPNGTGNVGINNASPAYKLDVTGDINFTGALRANGTAGTTGQVLVSQGTSNPVWSDISGAIGGDAWLQGGNSFGVTGVLGTNDNYDLQFETNNTTRMTIDTSGDVGIGTTNPGAKLETAGAISMTTGYGTISSTDIRTPTLGGRGTSPNAGSLAFGDNTGWKYHIGTSVTGTFTPRVTFVDSGNVGIGNTAPTSLLSVGSSSQFQVDSSGRMVRIDGVAHTIDDVSGNLTLTSNSTTISLNDNVTFAGTTTLNGLTYTWPGSQTANYVLSTNGSGTLTWVAADAAAAGSIYWTLTDEQLHPKNASWHDLMIGGTSTASAKFFAQANTGDGYFSGELGLGTTTPTAKLDIQATPSVYTSEVGNIRISNASDTTEKLYLGFDNNLGTYGSGYVQSSKTGTTWLPTLINPNGGYVGINNTSPSRALHVEDDSGIYVGDGTKNIQIFTSGTDNDISSSHTLHLNYNNNQAVSVGEGGTSNLYVSGSVGIGNTSPTSLFSVGSSSQFQVNSSGNIVNLGGAAHSISNASGNLTINSAGTLVLADTNIQLSGGSTTFDVYNNAADTTLTINNSSATYRSHLSLEGQLKLGTYTATPSAIAAGSVYYDSTLDKPYYYNGLGNWVPFGSGDGSGTSYWSLANGLLYPNNSTLDLTIGGSSTSSAAFAFTGISSSTRTATISGNLALSVPTGTTPATTLNILNGGTFDIKTSVGGDAGLTSRLFVSNAGNIGIGTTSPSAKLHVYDNSGSDLFFKLENANTDYQSRLSLTSTRSWDLISQGNLSGSNGSFWIYDATASQARLAIDTTGNVGIGTTTPGAKLDIAGASSTITNTSGDITINSASGKISFAGDSLNNFLHATASGQIKPGSYGSNPYPIGDGAIIYRSDLNQLYYYNGTSWQSMGSGSGYWDVFSGLLFPSNYSTYDLAVGGNTTASAKFFVNHSTGAIKIADSAGTDFHTIANDGNNLKITGSPNGSKLILQPDLQINGGDILGSSGSTRISLVDTLGLTSVSGFLAVDRAATISAGLASDLVLNLKGAASQTANYLAITSNGGSTGNIFTVDSSGNVGIGDTSPNAKLDVAGSATISGTLAVGVMNQADAGTCDAAAEGRIFYDKGTRIYKACTYNSANTSYAWRPLGGLSDQHRQDVSTNSVVNNQIIRKGWKYYAVSVGAAGSYPRTATTVSYGITFDSIPLVYATPHGTSATVPSSLSNCTYSTIEFDVESTSTTGFSYDSSGRGPVNSTAYACFTWIAIGSYSSGYGADLAEYYLTHDASLDAAEIVAIDPDNDIAVIKADPTANPAVVGVVSTQAGAILGNKDGTTPGVDTSITGQEVENGSKTVPVALAGRVPVKVSLENGPIYRGDALTLSPTLPGTAVKATTPGPIIGRALENFTGTATIIDSLNPDQINNEQELEQEAFDDLNQGIGKIMVFIQNSYFSPVMTASSATSSATIAFDHQGNLINPNDNLTAQAQASTQTNPSFFNRFISIIVKNLTALNITSRSITTQELISPLVEADQVITNTLNTNLIKPQPDSDLILSLNNQSATTTGQLLITDNQNNTVASINSSGNATFTGELTATSAKFNSLEVKNLKASQIEGLTDTLSQIKSASEAAKLFLDRLIAKHSAQDESLNATAQQLISTSSSQLLSTLEGNFTLDSDGTHLALTGLSSDYAYFSDYLAVEGTLMTNDLYVENNLITSSISSPLDAEDQTLYLQPTGTGAINLLSGLLILDESGTVSLNGNLIVTGTLESGSATISGTLDLRATNLDNSGEATHSGFGRLLSIYNEQGEQVASVNASGSAQFNDLTTRQIIIAASQDSTPSASQLSTNSNTTIGTATIPAGELTTYIENNNITSSTLIYITPISDTKNQVLYVKNKYSCPVDAPLSCQPFFTVAINQPTTQDIQFNYWLIQVQ